ncbi:hypothetical protein JW979_06685 [bacterium]|nr:hypothetical protein [candidate division CSSED10-310 bacterium]
MNSQKPAALSIPFQIIALSVLLTLLCGVLTPYQLSKTNTWPNNYYIMTSEWKFGQPESPWAYRLLKPIVAGLMPGDVRYNYIILTYISLIISAAGIYQLLRIFAVPSLQSTFAVIAFAFSYPFRNSLKYPWMLDDVTFLFLIFGVIAITLNKRTVFSILLTLGVCNHEHVLFLVPVYFFWVFSRRSFSIRLNDLIMDMFYLIPAAIMFIGIRIMIPIPNKEFFSYYLSAANIARCYQLQGGLFNIINLTYNTFGFLWILSLFACLKLKLSGIEKAVIFVVPLSLIQLVFGCDTIRLVAVNLPLLFILSFRVLSKIQPAWTFFTLVVLLIRSFSRSRFAGVSLFHPQWLMTIPTEAIVGVEMLAFLLLMYFYRNISHFE